MMGDEMTIADAFYKAAIKTVDSGLMLAAADTGHSTMLVTAYIEAISHIYAARHVGHKLSEVRYSNPYSGK